MKLDKGMLAAMGALAVLAGAVGWRVLGSQEASPAGAAEEAAGAEASIAALRAAAEADPGNALGWQQLGFALFQAGRFAEAASAYERATNADPQAAVLFSALGEARVMASRTDPLPEGAIAAFRRALELDPGDARARYFMAVKRDLEGDAQGAINDWLALLADTPPGAPWEADLVRTIEQVGAINRIAVAGPIAAALRARQVLPGNAQATAGAGPRGPTAQDIAAAAALTPSQQQEMAEAMVARLATRLEGQPGDVEGWIMLMRSYRQLGRDAEARAARDRAIAANPGAAARLREAARGLGIG